MRISEIEIKNFRAFYGSYRINLDKTGKNLLVYGENGSGKSSLYLALKLFLESAVRDLQFETHRNIFIKDDESGYIKLYLRADQHSKQDVYKWSRTAKETDDPLIIDASKTKGFLDYKALLATHYIPPEQEAVDIFDLLVNTLLANTINDVTDQNFADDWTDVQQAVPQRNTKKQLEGLKNLIQDFNTGLASKLEELRKQTSEILGKFGYNVTLNFDFRGITYNRDKKRLDNQQVLLTVKFFDRDIPSYHEFLNEAKLSAIAVAISFASFLLQPESDLKILALDDVLIGLDMSNRLPVIDIIKEYFLKSGYQVFFLTYDRAWYDIVRQRTDSKWKYVEFYSSKNNKCEIPIYREDQAYLAKAYKYFETKDYKACAIYLRTAFEVAIKGFCEEKGLQVRYCKNPQSNDFWTAIVARRKGEPFLEKELIEKIELYRNIILNPLSHSHDVLTSTKEIEETIEVVAELETQLKEKINEKI